MILQSLYALYGRLKDDPTYEIAPPGYSLQKITFKIVLRPDGLPSVGVQLFTFVFYALAIAGLWFHRRREPLTEAPVGPQELRHVTRLFALLLVLALGLSWFRRSPVLFPPIALNFAIWTFLGFLLTALSLAKGRGVSS